MGKPIVDRPGDLPGPIVSIGMPIFNSEKTLRAVIESLLCQSFRSFELIISDNYSTDATSKICQEYTNIDPRIIYIRQAANIGPARNFQYVFERATGKYFLWAAGDDLRSADFLKENIEFLESHADYVASTSPNCFEGQAHTKKNLVTFEIFGSIEQRLQQFFANCWKSHGIFYSVFQREIFIGCELLGKDFTAADWALDLFLIKHGNVHRTTNGLTVFGLNGISNSADQWKAFRKSAIERIIPFYFFCGHASRIVSDLPFSVRMKIIFWMLRLNATALYLQGHEQLGLLRRYWFNTYRSH